MINIPYRHQQYASILLLISLASPFFNVSTLTARLPGQQITSQLRQLDRKQIDLATTIKGTITTPIIWTDTSRPKETRATITFNEPLLDSKGDIALPKDSSLIVEVADWDDAGFVTLNAIAIIYQDSLGNSHQHAIPEGTFLIRNEDDLPLAFQTRESNDGNSIISGIVDEALQTGARNLPLPGGLGSVVSRTISNNSRRSRSSNREAVYSVEEKTKVSIYVNSFLSIEM